MPEDNQRLGFSGAEVQLQVTAMLHAMLVCVCVRAHALWTKHSGRNPEEKYRERKTEGKETVEHRGDRGVGREEEDGRSEEPPKLEDQGAKGARQSRNRKVAKARRKAGRPSKQMVRIDLNMEIVESRDWCSLCLSLVRLLAAQQILYCLDLRSLTSIDSQVQSSRKAPTTLRHVFLRCFKHQN